VDAIHTPSATRADTNVRCYVVSIAYSVRSVVVIRRALAGDVAAMANTAGGIIVIGIDEDEQACATAAPGVELTETETRRVLQVVGALVSPLPVFDVRRGFGDSRSRFAIAGDLVTAEAVVPLDDVSAPGRALISTAAVLVDEVGQAFGVPEMGQLSRDGKVRSRYWSHEWRPQLVTWAEQNGIIVTDDALGS
jgi:hypothetical protein